MQAMAIVVAGCSATGFAISTSLQHHAVDAAPKTADATHRLIAHLLARPWWLVGQVLATVSFTLHAVALRLGELLVVQPIVVSGIVLAVPVRAALNHRLPSRSEVGTVALTAAGLALFLVVARPTAGHPPTSPWTAPLLASGAVLAAAVATFVGGRTTGGVRAAGWFGTAAGLLFGLVAGLVKLTMTQVEQQGLSLSVLAYWAPWGVVLVGLSGVTLNQRAYRVAPLSASMPLLNIVNVMYALVFGYVVFGETPEHSPAAVLAEAFALACIATGLVRLSRSHVLDDADEDAATLTAGTGSRRGADER